MNYKNTRSGYTNYRVKKEQLRKRKNVRRMIITLGTGVTITLSIFGMSKIKEPKIDSTTNYYHIHTTNDLPKAGASIESISNVVAYDESSVEYQNDDLENMEIKQAFAKYCAIYNLDLNIIYNKASELTNGFTSDDFIINNRIIGTTVCKKERVFDNVDTGIMCFVRHCKQIPEDFGLEGNIETINKYSQELDCENLVSNYCSKFDNVEKELCMAIIYSENGRKLDGPQLNDNNNPGCLRAKEGMAHFENLEQGLIEMILNLNYAFMEDLNIKSYEPYTKISMLQKIYAPIDDPENQDRHVNENWLPNVTKTYSELKNDYYSIYVSRNQLNR